MISKELDLSALTEIFETIFDLESASRAVDRVISEQQVRLVHELEKTLSALWMGLCAQPEKSEQENALIKKLQEMMSGLRHGLIENDKPSFFSAGGSLFAKRRGYLAKKSVRR